MPSLGLHYSLGIDGLSLLLIALTIFTNLIVILATWDSIHTKVGQYLSAFLIMQGLLVGVFSALDAIVFYIFWEATLIPMYGRSTNNVALMQLCPTVFIIRSSCTSRKAPSCR